VDIHDVAVVLSKTQLFGALDARSCAELAGRASVRVYGKDMIIFAQDDDSSDHLFVVAEGSVRLLIRSLHGEAMELARRWPPDVFGELALLDGGPRSASAEAAERTVLIAISRIELIRFMRSHEGVLDALLRSLGSLVRRANEQSTDLVFLNLPARVAKKLLELAHRNRATPADALRLRVSQADLAQMVGGARQTVNQVLRAFERRRLIRVSHRTVEVLDEGELRREAGWDDDPPGLARGPAWMVHDARVTRKAASCSSGLPAKRLTPS